MKSSFPEPDWSETMHNLLNMIILLTLITVIYYAVIATNLINISVFFFNNFLMFLYNDRL